MITLLLVGYSKNLILTLKPQQLTIDICLRGLHRLKFSNLTPYCSHWQSDQPFQPNANYRTSYYFLPLNQLKSLGSTTTSSNRIQHLKISISIHTQAFLWANSRMYLLRMLPRPPTLSLITIFTRSRPTPRLLIRTILHLYHADPVQSVAQSIFPSNSTFTNVTPNPYACRKFNIAVNSTAVSLVPING